MNQPVHSAVSSQVLLAIDEQCERFEDALRGGNPSRLEDFLVPPSADCGPALLFEYLLRIEVDFRLSRGETVSPGEYAARFPSFAQEVRQVLPSARCSKEPVQIGPYRIVGKLGSGGMGQVYQAFQQQLDRFVAIKVLPTTLLHDAAARLRFQRELRAAGKVSHPNLVSAYDAGEDGESLFLVMELVAGLSLAEISRCKPMLEIADACEVIRQAAMGVAEVHRHGLIHRDIKPGNLMLGWNERVKVLDLGLALLFERAGEADGRELTAAGQLMGTLEYMAPEQCLDSHHVDRRADIYGLGATLYRLLTGSTPHGHQERGAAIARLSAKLSSPIVPLRQLRPACPIALERLLARMLARTPADRPPSAEEVIRELEPFCRGADLSRLLAQVSVTEREETRQGSPKDSTSPHVVPTVGSTEHAAEVSPLPFQQVSRWRRVPISISVVLLLGATLWAARQFSDRSHPLRQAIAEDIGPAEVGWHDWPADAPEPAIAPFTAVQAKQRQKEWAEYLQLPIEWENSVGLKFQLIPPGEFFMGTSSADVAALKLTESADRHDRLNSEMPQHRVVVTRPFYISAHEVTQKAYQQVSGANPSEFSTSASDVLSKIDSSRFPVDSVSWDDAVAFCAKLTGREPSKPLVHVDQATAILTSGPGYRLPTEAEWEFACRAGTTTKFSAGEADEQLAEAAWLGTNSDGRPHFVGEKKANPWGLFDMHGNVWEWVHDCYEPTYYAEFSEQAAVDPRGPVGDTMSRVIRGGHWSGDASVSRSAFRSYHYPSARFHDIGFRVVATVETAWQAIKTDKRRPQRGLD